MAVFSTEENNKDEYLEETLQSLSKTVNFNYHRMMISINSQTKRTKELIKKYEPMFEDVIYNGSNIGTAEAINKIWLSRRPGEHCLKMDDDVVIHYKDWLDLMEEVLGRDPNIGQVGLKRKDCLEAPWVSGWYKSELLMLPHKPGEKWIVVEKVNHIMGTCVLHSSSLLDRIGFLIQPTQYGFDDSLMSFRSQQAGFINVFIPHIQIDHIDPGVTKYQKWKEASAQKDMAVYNMYVNEYKSGKRDLFYSPFNSNEYL